MTAEEYFGDWYKCLSQSELGSVLGKVKAAYDQTIVYPYFKEIFSAFRYCDYNNLKVVILGMDPYNDGYATGLAFANRAGTKKLSPSLRVIENCLQREYSTDRPIDCTLMSWAKQGVLLLNSSLTVEALKPGSHSMLWRKFIASFLQNLGQWQTGIVYVLMGEQAKTFKPYIGLYNDVITCKHPAYYARCGQSMPRVFKDIDTLTVGKNNLKITWI